MGSHTIDIFCFMICFMGSHAIDTISKRSAFVFCFMGSHTIDTTGECSRHVRSTVVKLTPSGMTCSISGHTIDLS